MKDLLFDTPIIAIWITIAIVAARSRTHPGRPEFRVPCVVTSFAFAALAFLAMAHVTLLRWSLDSGIDGLSRRLVIINGIMALLQTIAWVAIALSLNRVLKGLQSR